MGERKRRDMSTSLERKIEEKRKQGRELARGT